MMRKTNSDAGDPRGAASILTRPEYVAVRGEAAAATRIVFNRALFKPVAIVLLVICVAVGALAIFRGGLHRSVSVGDRIIVQGLVFTSPSQVIMQTESGSIWVLKDGPTQNAAAIEQSRRIVCAQGQVTTASEEKKLYTMHLSALLDCERIRKR